MIKRQRKISKLKLDVLVLNDLLLYRYNKIRLPIYDLFDNPTHI